MTKILSFSGKKQSGKTTAANYVFGLEMLSLRENDRPMLINWFAIDEQGRLVIPTNEGDGIFDPINPPVEAYDFMIQNIWPTVKMFYFADKLKQDVCINILGLTPQQCYGSDEDKNSLTALRWEDMPGVLTTPLNEHLEHEEVIGRLGKYYERVNGVVYHEPGFMTAREVMQFVGTDIFRKMYSNVWVDSTIRSIQEYNSGLSLIGDCRFPGEVEGIQKAGGKVIRFTRNPNPGDAHESETALDEDKFDWNKFDAVIDNKDMDINTQNNAVYAKLLEWGYISYEVKFEDGKMK